MIKICIRRKNKKPLTMNSSPIKKVYKKIDKKIPLTGKAKVKVILDSMIKDSSKLDSLDVTINNTFQNLSKEESNLVSSYIIDEYIKELENNLASTGDDAQLANIDLQNALQKQQQNIQTLSNVSKMIHDTTTAVIRKIG